MGVVVDDAGDGSGFWKRGRVLMVESGVEFRSVLTVGSHFSILVLTDE